MANFVNFTFGNGTAGQNLAAYAPGANEIGGPWSVNPVYNDAFVVNAAGRVRDNGGSVGAAYYSLAATPYGADYSAEADFYLADGYGGLILAVRFDPAALTGYALRYQAYYGWQILRMDGYNNFTVLGTSPQTGGPATTPATIHAKIACSGSTVTATLSGAQAGTWSATDSKYTAAGKVGLISFAAATDTTGVQLDNLVATVPDVPKLGVTGPAGAAVPAGGTYALNGGNPYTKGDAAAATFTLADLGTVAVNLGTVALSGCTATANPSNTSVAVGGSAPLSLSFSTAAAGPINATVSIPSNDAASPYTFSVTGQVNNPTAPNAPTNLAARPTSSTAVALSWTCNSTNDTGMVVQWSADGSTNWATLATAAAHACSSADTTVPASTTRYYRVYATNAVGPSATTAVASATTPAPGTPLNPSNLVATPVSDTEVNLTWDRGDDSDVAVVVERSPDISGSAGTYAPVAVLPARSNVFIDISCWPSTTYHWRVKARGTGGDSNYATAQAATPACAGTLAPVTALSAAAADMQTVNLSWPNPAGNTCWVDRSTDGGVTYTPLAWSSSPTGHTDTASGPAAPGGAGTPMPAYNTPLSPNTRYTYRVRPVDNAGNFAPFAGPVSATTPARPAGTAAGPSGLNAVVNGPASVTLTWTDNSGGTAATLVERSTLSVFSGQSWTQIASVPAGTTTYTDTGVSARTVYQYRLRASNASGASEYTMPTLPPVRTSSPPNPAGPRVYDVGPGTAYTTIGSFPWDNLGPGDTVNVHAKPNQAPYYERLVLTCRGTAAAPITVRGIPDAAGNLPILDGTNATTAASMSVSYPAYESWSLVFVGTHATNDPSGPGYLTIQGLELRNAYSGNTPNTFTGYQGTSSAWGDPAAGLYIQKGDHITVRGCSVHDNGNGIFFSDKGDLRVYAEDISVLNCKLYNNGIVNQFGQHNMYMEGLRTTVDGCALGPPRPGSAGNNLKDRGAGTVVRYNRFDVAPGAHLLDLVDASASFSRFGFLPEYRAARVYGNAFKNDGSVGTAFHYGYDQGNPFLGRKGVLYFYNNTVVTAFDGSAGQPGLQVFAVCDASGTVDARNNVLASVPVTAGHAVQEIDLLPQGCCGYFRANWATAPWYAAAPYGGAFTGKAAGSTAFTTGSDPLVVSWASNDLRLTASSPARGQGAPAADVLGGSVARQYMAAASTLTRPTTNDCGAFEYINPAGTPPALSGLAVDATGLRLTGTLSVPCDPPFGTAGFAASAGAGVSVASWSASGTALTLYLSNPVGRGQAVTLSYAAPGNVVDGTGDPLAAFTAAAVTNNSAYVSVTTPPTVPAGLTVTPGVHSNALSWSPSSATSPATVASYSVFRDGSQVASTTGTAYTDAGLAYGTSHSYTVCAIDSYANVSAASASASGVPLSNVPPPPQAPTCPAAPRTVNLPLSWAAVPGAASYNLYRGGVLIASGLTGTSYTDAVAPGTYSYAVAAVASDGASAPGASYAATAAAAPARRLIVSGGQL